MGFDRTVLFRLATSRAFERLVRSLPGGEPMAWRSASRYVAGPTETDACMVVDGLARRGAATSIDRFGELVADRATVDSEVSAYVALAASLTMLPPTTWLSVDLSHLGLDLDHRRCARDLAKVVGEVPAGRRVQVGAEDHTRTERTLACVLEAARSGPADRLGATVQANLRRSPGDAERLVAAGVHVRLVKGAYVESPRQALPYGEPTDLAYLGLADQLADLDADFALATHDGVLRESVLRAVGRRTVEQLWGVRPQVVADLVARDIPVRVYVPFGDSWFRYWMRRMAESRGP